MLYSQKEVQLELRKYIQPNSLHGFALYISDISLYLISIYGVLFLPELWMKLAASIFAGVKLGNLATVAHDAAHNSLTKLKSLNKFIAITSFLPCLFNYRLWLLDHNVLHHVKTNENIEDSYTPLSKEEYDSLSPFNKWKERLYRKPSFLYFGLYYIVERWRKVKLYPTAKMPEYVKKSGWMHSALISVYFLAFIAVLACAPKFSNTGSIAAVVLGFVIPFYVFQTVYAFTVYVQHTHKRIAWFNYKPDRKGNGRQEFVSVSLEFPGWLSILMHNVYSHAAHHVCPAIPCYRLKDAQVHLDKLIGEKSVSERFTFSWLFETMQACKLYDYDNNLWLDFDGNITSQIEMIDDSVKFANAA